MSNATSEVRTKEIKRRDLLKMASLGKDLEKNDVVFLSNRGELDAVMMSPESALDLIGDNGVRVVEMIQKRMYRDSMPVLTERSIAILLAIGKLDQPRLVDVAEFLKQPASNLHRTIQEMVNAELVVRHEDDEITYSLADLAQELIQREVGVEGCQQGE